MMRTVGKALFPCLSVAWLYLTVHYWYTMHRYVKLGLVNLPVYSNIEWWFLYSCGLLTVTVIMWIRLRAREESLPIGPQKNVS